MIFAATDGNRIFGLGNSTHEALRHARRDYPYAPTTLLLLPVASRHVRTIARDLEGVRPVFSPTGYIVDASEVFAADVLAAIARI